jgi:hypothetical protein
MKASNQIRADRAAILGSRESALEHQHVTAWATLELAAQIAELRETIQTEMPGPEVRG